MERRIIRHGFPESGKGRERLFASKGNSLSGLDLFENPYLGRLISIQKLLDVVDILATLTIQDRICLELEPSDDGQLHLVVETLNGLVGITLRIIDKWCHPLNRFLCSNGGSATRYQGLLSITPTPSKRHSDLLNTFTECMSI